jgi:inosine/xanthosine triphosphatase
MPSSPAAEPLRIVVASINPVKIASTREGFAAVFGGSSLEISGFSAASGVSDQPFGSEETLKGALNRAQNVRTSIPEVDYHVGIEGGVEAIGEDMYAFAWVVIMNGQQSGRAKTGAFMLPREVSALVRQGIELGHADDRVFGRVDSKRQTGSIGILTGDVVTRTTFYSPAVIMALIPFINPALDFGA